ncbi:hypothetical protein K501DRAFT_329930 [Backusella circina FSU 941]|nr:hypothetical protein K501DRAFT_329930 [Backusella circina FSU 941]
MTLYQDGRGVSQDICAPMDYSLKAAAGNNKSFMTLLLMSSNTKNTFTREELFASLENDRQIGLKIASNTIAKLKNGTGKMFWDIGFIYNTTTKDYAKAMAWFRLSANQNYPAAYGEIGVLYFSGLGVPQDYDAAMYYFLKGAESNNITSIVIIGLLFSQGLGVLVDNYKALEWLTISNCQAEKVKLLNEKGFHLSNEDKKKTIYQLINETEEIRRKERRKKEEEMTRSIEEAGNLRKELQNDLQQSQQKIDSLEEEKQLQTSREEKETKRLLEEMENLRKELQKAQNESQQKQQMIELLKEDKEANKQLLENKDQMIFSLERENKIHQSLVQSKDNEINSLKENRYLERENRELKRKMARDQRPLPISFADYPTSENDTINDNGNLTNDIINNNSTESDASDSDVNSIMVKTEVSDLRSCKVENKRRKVQ